MSRITKPTTLIDTVKPTLPDGLVAISVNAHGDKLQFRFRDKNLPQWYGELANRLDWTRCDNDPGGKFPGRRVSLERPKKDSNFYHNVMKEQR